MAQRLPTTVAAVLLVWLCRGGGGTMNAPAMAIEGERFAAQALASRGADIDNPDGGTATAITRGMGKEAVRTMWGKPEELRKIRTCFGWQEGWVYRGNPKRFGANERVPLFDLGRAAPGYDHHQSRWQDFVHHQPRRQQTPDALGC